MNHPNLTLGTYASQEEVANRASLAHLLESSPIPTDQLLSNLGLFLESKNLGRLLFLDHVYRQVIDVQGIIMEFGTRWGQNLGVLAALRGIYEPFNRHRKIVGFDTFSGFPSVSQQDGGKWQDGQLSVTEGYSTYLEKVLQVHEHANPLAHIKKFELCAGDATAEVPRYLMAHPETIVAMAYFDFDLYEPTKACLEAIRPRLTKGSVVVFDELNDPDSPGETTALMEVFGLNAVRLKRFQYASRVSFFVVE
ncbi:MAG: crotonobetainyl-CoA--carnitine CoA-transferase [Nitrospirota bacterium]|nr:crotonobetainyl-CoA--carnitine CoA-transferase [Nitrospirota bacterium]MDH5701091.1 crotonobetainyl-CoA--carnitine CoA-transferase [Nitrospirota bacterium]